MTKEQLKILHLGSWYEECIDFLDDEFFNPDKQIRFQGDKNYYNLEPVIVKQLRTLQEQIEDEQEYRRGMIKVFAKNEITQFYIEYVLEVSRQKEQKLLNKMVRRNAVVGDIDKARAYPIENIIEFNRAGFAKCPWHDDGCTPNLHWYKEANRAHCFVCQKTYDSIDAARALWRVDFRTAVNKLSQ